MNNEYFRGYAIEKTSAGNYVYADNGDNVAETWTHRPCGYCHRHNTAEGYDGCIGEVAGAINACCGHGNVDEAYVQYSDGRRIGGKEAINIFKREAGE